MHGLIRGRIGLKMPLDWIFIGVHLVIIGNLPNVCQYSTTEKFNTFSEHVKEESEIRRLRTYLRTKNIPRERVKWVGWHVNHGWSGKKYGQFERKWTLYRNRKSTYIIHVQGNFGGVPRAQKTNAICWHLKKTCFNTSFIFGQLQNNNSRCNDARLCNWEIECQKHEKKLC